MKTKKSQPDGGAGVKETFKCLPRGAIERNVLEAITKKGMTVKAVSQKTGNGRGRWGRR